MSFNLRGNGTYTSSAAITDYNLPLNSPSIPEPYHTEERTRVHETESGFVHGYTLGRAMQRWDVRLALLTAQEMRDLLSIYDTIGESGYLTWYTSSGSADATSTTSYLDDTAAVPGYDYTNHYVNYTIWSLGGGAGPPAGETRRISASADLSGGWRFTVSKLWSVAPVAATVYIWGRPVRFVGGIRREHVPANLFNVNFTFEEYILPDTVT